MGLRTFIEGWPVYRQLAGADSLGRGAAARSARSAQLGPRTGAADTVVKSVCPYCAVGCGQDVYVKDGKVVQIEGDPDSQVSRGRLCPKGSASLQLVNGNARRHRVLYRRPYGTDWKDLDLDTAMDMIADRVIDARRHGWQQEVDGRRTRRTLGFASLGGATLDNEENYLIKKLFTALGTSWDDAAAEAIRAAAGTLRDLRVAEVVKQDIHLDEAGGNPHRTKLQLSFSTNPGH